MINKRHLFSLKILKMIYMINELIPKRITELKANEIFVFGSNFNGFLYGDGIPLFVYCKFGDDNTPASSRS